MIRIKQKIISKISNYQILQHHLSSQKMGNKLNSNKNSDQGYLQNNCIQQIQVQKPNSYNQKKLLRNQNRSNSGTMKLLNEKQEDKNKKVVAVIVTLNIGGSYDDLFRSVQQKSLEGTKVQVYACDSQYIDSLISAFNGAPKDDISIRLMNTIKQVDKDCVLFNWQCCGGYSCKSFSEGQDELFKFLKIIIDKGHMAMFSDFSLKALINSWNQKYQLGPNPFVQTSQYTGNFEIRFKSGQLKQCPSSQLQTVGDLCQEGRCNLMAASGTIVYCVNNNKIKNDKYTIQVLTVVSTLKAPKAQYSSKIDSYEGTAGHVLVKYPSGGMILTSMGHWVQLMKIDTSQQKLFEVAQRQYGLIEVQKMRQNYSRMGGAERKCYIQTNAMQFVKNQAPCRNMNKKSR